MSIKNLLPRVKLERASEIRKKVAIGATIGLTVGAVAGVLLAPKAGKDNRKDLMKTIHELPAKVKPVSDKAQEKIRETKEKITGKTHKFMGDAKEKGSGINTEVHDDMYFKKLTAKAEEAADAFQRDRK